MSSTVMTSKTPLTHIESALSKKYTQIHTSDTRGKSKPCVALLAIRKSTSIYSTACMCQVCFACISNSISWANMWRLSCNWHCKNRIYLRFLLWKVGTVPNISMSIVVSALKINAGALVFFFFPLMQIMCFTQIFAIDTWVKILEDQVLFLLDITYQLWKSHVKTALLYSRAASESWESTGSTYKIFLKL